MLECKIYDKARLGFGGIVLTGFEFRRGDVHEFGVAMNENERYIIMR